MRKIGIAGVPASSLFLGFCCVLGLSRVADDRTVATRRNLPEAVIAYGFLRSNYGDFDQLLVSTSTFAAGRDMKALQDALDSLGCDLPTRLAFPHRDLVVAFSSDRNWIGFPRTNEFPREEGMLFVIRPLPTAPHRTWVVLSSVAPERTTVLWLDGDKRGYVSGLVYDSFSKGVVKNAPKASIGLVISVSVAESGEILLKEWSEPGSRPHARGAAGRVFEVNSARRDITLRTAGTLPQS